MTSHVHHLLADKFTKYRDLVSIPVQDNGEVLVNLADSGIRIAPQKSAVAVDNVQAIYVRQSVVQKMIEATHILQNYREDLFFEVVYGYRSGQVQESSFQKIWSDHQLYQLPKEEALEKAHTMIAVPDVAGHPTGGAIDLQLVNENGNPLDMGTSIHDFLPNSYVFSPFISSASWRWRQVLRNCMITAGFAPFDGEWWHFSYGDREWAFYYNKPTAIFDQIVYQNER